MAKAGNKKRGLGGGGGGGDGGARWIEPRARTSWKARYQDFKYGPNQALQGTGAIATAISANHQIECSRFTMKMSAIAAKLS